MAYPALTNVPLNVDPQGYAGSVVGGYAIPGVQVPSAGPGPGGMDFGGLLRRIAAQREAAEQAQLQALQEQIARARTQFSWMAQDRSTAKAQADLDRMRARQAPGRARQPDRYQALAEFADVGARANFPGAAYDPFMAAQMVRAAGNYLGPEHISAGLRQAGQGYQSQQLGVAPLAQDTSYSSFAAPMSPYYGAGIQYPMLQRPPIPPRSAPNPRGRTFKEGGYVPETRKYMLHKGEMVVPANVVRHFYPNAQPDRDRTGYQAGTPVPPSGYPMPPVPPMPYFRFGSMGPVPAESPAISLPPVANPRIFGQPTPGQAQFGMPEAPPSFGMEEPMAGIPGATQLGRRFEIKTPMTPAEAAREDRLRKIRESDERANMNEVEAEDIHNFIEKNLHRLDADTYKLLNERAKRKMDIAKNQRVIGESQQKSIDAVESAQTNLANSILKVEAQQRAMGERQKELGAQRFEQNKYMAQVNSLINDAKLKDQRVTSLMKAFMSRRTKDGGFDPDTIADFAQALTALERALNPMAQSAEISREAAQRLLENPGMATQLDAILAQ